MAECFSLHKSFSTLASNIIKYAWLNKGNRNQIDWKENCELLLNLALFFHLYSEFFFAIFNSFRMRNTRFFFTNKWILNIFRLHDIKYSYQSSILGLAFFCIPRSFIYYSSISLENCCKFNWYIYWMAGFVKTFEMPCLVGAGFQFSAL